MNADCPSRRREIPEVASCSPSSLVLVVEAPRAAGPGPADKGRARGRSRFFALTLSLLVWLAGSLAGRAASFSEWQNRQEFQVPNAGLLQFSLPAETLDAARADLADLRLADAAGNEVPYLIVRPAPTEKIVRPAKSFGVELASRATTLEVETGLSRPIDGVTLATPAMNFIKPVAVAGLTAAGEWQTLASGQPIFRQPNGAERLRVSFPAGSWARLRLTVDDRNAPPIPFTGAQVHAAAADPTPTDPVAVEITERVEMPGETRLALNLGAAHLRLAALEIETPDPLFHRPITLAVRQVEEGSIREVPLAHDTVYRVAVGGPTAAERLRVPLDVAVPNRELVLRIQNGDSPPLQVTAVRAARRPVDLLFYAAQPGTFQLFTGNRLCAAPRYDLAAQGANLKSAPLVRLSVSAPAANPAFHPPETLPQVRDTGAALDVSAWRFRKPVRIARPGMQQLELDLDVLAGARPGFEDLRLLRDGQQLPYLIERTSITRSLKVETTRADDPRQPKSSRWSLKLPRAGLPVTRLTCTSSSPLFRREVALSEEATDDRGTKYRRSLGSATWVQSPEAATKSLSLTLSAAPLTDTVLIETDNEDNPPIALADFEFAQPVTRVFFKTASAENVFLFYGNREAVAPRYDLSLVAAQVFQADKQTATLGAQESWRKPSWSETRTPGKGGVLFWGALGAVVVALLVLIARLMPKPPAPPS